VWYGRTNNKGIPPGAWTKCIDPCQLLDIAKTSRLPVPQNSPIGRRVLSMIMLDRKSYIGKEEKKKQLSRSLLEFLLELASQ
jgi:hypothetical protein